LASSCLLKTKINKYNDSFLQHIPNLANLYPAKLDINIHFKFPKKTGTKIQTVDPGKGSRAAHKSGVLTG
jgi:hypothetical protein